MNLRIPIKLLSLVICKKTARWPSSKISLALNNVCQHGCTSRMFSVSKRVRNEDEITNDEMNEMLAHDTELQSMLKDIIKDFDPNPPPPEPPKVRQHTDTDMDSQHDPNYQDDDDDSLQKVPMSLLQRYKQFKDEDAEVILDVHEEQKVEEDFYLYQEKKDRFANLDLKRGKEGVFDLPELVTALRDENAQDIAVVGIPKELHYADYLVVASAKSPRHSGAVMECLRKMYKLKKNSKDPFLRIEGENCHDWKVLDMGNIVVHMFLPEVREKYDIETLWTVGVKYDDLCNQPPDPFEVMLEEEMKFLEVSQAQSAKQ